MKTKISLTLTALSILGVSYAVYWYLSSRPVSLLQPKGEIAQEQYELLVFASVLSLIVVIPVYVMLIGFAWRYRAQNKKAAYKPNWDSNKKAEAIWWGIPIILIFILSVITWQSSHSLDPYKPLASTKKPVQVQVVALQWKWLFIYPEYGVSTVNKLVVPEQTPINFAITADAPMNSFWIPDLGGQIYAMAGMQTKLHLMAESTGSYPGYSSNISGEGFANMRFDVESLTENEFNTWLQQTALSTNTLDAMTYEELAAQSIVEEPIMYGTTEAGLFTDIIDSYMHHVKHTTNDHGEEELDSHMEDIDSYMHDMEHN